MADTTQVSQSTTDAAGHVHDSAQSKIYSKTKDPRLAQDAAARATATTIAAPAWVIGIIGGALSYLAKAAAFILDLITKSKLAGQPGIHDLIVSALADVLQLDLSSEDVPVGKGPAGQRAVNTVLGQKFLGQLKTLLGADSAVTGESAERGAAAFLGFGMQLSASTAFLGVLGELFSLGHVQDVAEVGEMLEKSLGMGRLTRRLLGPYLRNVVELPLDRKLRAQYRQDIIGAHELIRAIFRGGPLASQARTLLSQHGFPEDQIDELVEQGRPHLSESELDTLVLFNVIDQAEAVAHIGAAGVPAATAQLRFKAITEQRLSRLREAGMAEVLGFISHGRLPSTAVESAFNDFGIPDLERDLWRARAAYYLHVRRRELSKADVIYLYENGQFTLDEVKTWADEMGYDTHDAMAIELEALQKTQDFQTRKDAAKARSTTSAHARNVAFVTDQFLKIAIRTPTAAELSKWVDLLDKRERTRADVTAELKLEFES